MSNSAEKKISDKKASPDRIDEHLRVGSPGVFILIAALILVVVAFVVWGLTGKLPVTRTTKGFVWTLSEEELETLSEEDRQMYGEDGEKAMVMVLYDSSQYTFKQFNEKTAVIKTAAGYTVECKDMVMTDIPLSRAEIEPLISDKSDWLVERIVDGDYNYVAIYYVDKELKEHMYETVDVTVVVEEIPPIKFLLR